MNPQLLWLIPILPFAGFLLNGTLGRRLPRAAVATIALLFTLVPALLVLELWSFMKSVNGPLTLSTASHPWIAVSGLSLDFAAIIDAKRPLANAARSSPADPGAVRLSSWPVATLLGLTGARLRCDQRRRDRKRGPGLTILNR